MFDNFRELIAMEVETSNAENLDMEEDVIQTPQCNATVIPDDVSIEADSGEEEKLWIWKKNVPILYDVMYCYNLPFPSLTVEWAHNSDKLTLSNPEGESVEQLLFSLVTGTYNLKNDQNYLELQQLKMSRPPKLTIARDNIGIATNLEFADPSIAKSKSKQQAMKIEIKTQVSMFHSKEVNRARIMPQNKFTIATRGMPNKDGFCDVLIYKYNKFKQNFDILADEKNQVAKPNYILRHHKDEGFGISWNPNKKGELVTCGKDRDICLWTLKENSPEAPAVIKPDKVISGHHTDSIEDIAWHPQHPTLFCSVGNDSNLFLWDSRDTTKPAAARRHCHSDLGINSVSWNPLCEHLLATGGSDSNVCIYDVRNLTKPVHTINGKYGDVSGEIQVLQWSPFRENILASGCNQGRIAIWDLCLQGVQQTEEEKATGPPELLFLHEGHSGYPIYDLSWNPQHEWMLASVASDSFLHIWKMGSCYQPTSKPK